jgi:hypothetical protein
MISFNMAVQPGRQHGIDVGEKIDQSLQELHMLHKEAWIICGFKDGASWSRALQGVPGYPLDLWKLTELPFAFWMKFLPRFVAEQVSRHMREAFGDRRRMVRAEYESEKKEGAA